MRTRRVFLLLAVAALGGCAATSSVLVGRSRPAIQASEVRIYLSPPKQYEEIAVLDASSKNSWAITDQGKMDIVIQRLKEEAAKLGANGVLLQSSGSVSAGSVVVGSGTATRIGGTTFGSGLGTAIPVMHKGGAGIAIYVTEQ